MVRPGVLGAAGSRVIHAAQPGRLGAPVSGTWGAPRPDGLGTARPGVLGTAQLHQEAPRSGGLGAPRGGVAGPEQLGADGLGGLPTAGSDEPGLQEAGFGTEFDQPVNDGEDDTVDQTVNDQEDDTRENGPEPEDYGDFVEEPPSPNNNDEEGGPDDGDDAGDGDDDHSSDDDGCPGVLQANIDRHNRFRNPMLWSNTDMRTLIKVWKNEFVVACNNTRLASRHSRALTHEARVFLFLYRMIHGTSAQVLGALFNVTPMTALKSFDDLLFYHLYFDPFIPSHDNTMTNVELESLLLGVRNRQSPGIRYILIANQIS